MPRPHPLSRPEVQRAIAVRFTDRVDRLRQLHTRFGLRPRRLFLVWTQYSGEERGEGAETELRRVEILPTPLVVDSTAEQVTAAGTTLGGSVRVTEVSARYTWSDLMGQLQPLASDKVPDPYDFFYELVFDGRYEDAPQRRKFRLATPPQLAPEEFGWTLNLTAYGENRDRQAQNQLGTDRD